jgi:hypothetical protein
VPWPQRPADIILQSWQAYNFGLIGDPAFLTFFDANCAADKGCEKQTTGGWQPCKLSTHCASGGAAVVNVPCNQPAFAAHATHMTTACSFQV